MILPHSVIVINNQWKQAVCEAGGRTTQHPAKQPWPSTLLLAGFLSSQLAEQISDITFHPFFIQPFFKHEERDWRWGPATSYANSLKPVHIKVHQADKFIYPKSKVTAGSVLCNEAYVCQCLSRGWKQWCQGFFCIIIRASRSPSRPPNRPSSQSQSLVMSSGRDKVIIACHYVRAETQTNENESPLVKEKWQ